MSDRDHVFYQRTSGEWPAVDRRHTPDHIAQIEARLKQGQERMDAFEKQLLQNTKMTADIHEWVGKGRGFFSVLGVLGSTVKWLAATLAAGVLLWKFLFTRDGGPPTPPPAM